MPRVRRICLKTKSMNPKDLRSGIEAAGPQPAQPSDASALDDLRELLVGPEKQKLAQIEERIEKRLEKSLLNAKDLSHIFAGCSCHEHGL